MTQYTLSDLRNLTQEELSILYVEDEAMLREGMVGSLRQLFKGVEVAEDGAIGLALYENSHYDLVITDISMPNMDGITMIRPIKSVNPEARIIVTSAQNDADKLLELINLGVDRFLTKPIDKTMLIETLFSVCNAIISIKQARAYQEQLEQKVRLLETNLTKEYIKTKAAASISEENKEYDNSYEDYFQHLLREEIDELCELNEELDYDILLAFQNDRIDPAYVSRVSQRYNRYGAILSRHSAFSHIGLGLQTMCREFDAHQQLFIDRIASIRALLESFNFTLITFRKKILQISSSNPTFYNASLLSDISMIVNLLNQTEIDSDIEFFSMDTLSILYIGKNTETLETIRQYDSDITHVNSPEEGLDQFSKKAIDALIVESGDEMKESLSAIEKFKIRKKNLLCVIITAYPDQESLIRSISIGLSDILIHPFEPSDIDTLIKKLRVSALLNRQLSQKNLLLNQYKNALDASLIIARTDTSGNIIYINDKFCDITGYTPSEIIGHTHRLFKHPETPTEQMVQLWNTISTKKVWHGTVINLTKKGETFYTDTFVIPILNEQHEIVEYMDIRIDITEIKNYLQIIQNKVDEATKAIQAQQQQLIAQSRAAALGEMFDNIAHQWRQPIGAINNAIINAEFAIELGSIQESAVLETFEQIKTYTAFLSKTIDDFRNFSNPDKEKTHFSLHSSISQTINIIRGAYEMNHISLDYALDDLLRNVEVYGPQGEFSQVILNILGNARDAIKEKQLPNAQVRIKVSAGNKTISLSISDNAGGIPEAVLPKIFDPYFSTKGHAQGTGIGLYMSKTIIEKHFYGNLEADNGEDGAIFTITLPIYQSN